MGNINISLLVISLLSNVKEAFLVAMDTTCEAKNIIHVLQCGGCGEDYIGFGSY